MPVDASSRASTSFKSAAGRHMAWRRTPKGAPKGGQFASSYHGESGVTLNAEPRTTITRSGEINDRLIRLHALGSEEQIAAVWAEAREQFDMGVAGGALHEGGTGEVSGIMSCVENALDIQEGRV